jgi:hypothetical protein
MRKTMQKFHEAPMSKPTQFFRAARRALAALALVTAVTAGLRAAPGWSSLMNYQGQLTDSAGVTVADGAYSIQFSIYDAVSGGTLIWQETQGSVQVTKGLFNVVLGSVSAISLGSYYTGDLWLGVKVGADAEMTPRQQLLPAVYAYNAQRLNGASVGAGAGDIPQLNGSGKIPASMIGAGSVSVPMDMSGPGGSYNLHVNNTSALGTGVIAESATGVGVSATATSVSVAGLWAEGARYGAIVKTYDAALGVALQAQGPGSAYASLVDRVNNAQVFGQAAASNVYGVLGTNSNGSGVGVGGQGGFAGVSGSGATGVYGQGTTQGVYGTGTSYGVYALGGAYGIYARGSSYSVYAENLNGNYAVLATSNYMGILASGTTYGISTSSNNIGLNASSSGSTGKAINALETSSSGLNYGIYSQSNSTAGVGVGGYYVNGAAGTARGVQGTSNSSTGIGVEGVGYNGVRGASTVAGGFGMVGTVTDSAGFGAYFENTGAGAGATGLAVRSLTSTSGIAIQAQASASSGIGVSATGGLYGMIANGSTGGLQANSSNGYAVEANGYGGINVDATNNYGLNIISNNNWAIQVNSSNSYGMVNFSYYGVYSQSNAGSAFTGYSNVDGVYGYTQASGSSYAGVHGEAGCSPCYGVYGRDNSNVAGSVGIYGQGFSAIRAQSNSSAANSINFESDVANNPQYGFYHFNSGGLAGSFGMLLQNSGSSAIGAQITNQVPTGAATGSALVVKGRMRLTDCNGRVNTATTGTSWVINSSVIGTAGANCIEPNSVIQLTLITISGYPLYVSSVGTGTFTVSCATTLTNPQFYYTIFGK